jgi:hypothetical protein
MLPTSPARGDRSGSGEGRRGKPVWATPWVHRSTDIPKSVLGFLTGDLQLVFCWEVHPRGGPPISSFTESLPNRSHHLNRRRRRRGWIVGHSMLRGEVAEGSSVGESTNRIGLGRPTGLGPFFCGGLGRPIRPTEPGHSG